MEGCGLDLYGSGQVRLAGSSEDGSVSSGSGSISGILKQLLAYHEGLLNGITLVLSG